MRSFDFVSLDLRQIDDPKRHESLMFSQKFWDDDLEKKDDRNFKF